MAKIKDVTARQLIDCNCRPMVEVDVITDEGLIGRGSAPTGSSVGMHEACVLRDHDPKEYDGMSVHQAVDNVNRIIGPAIRGMDVHDQTGIDACMIELDGTKDKSRLGGNAIYSTSIAAFRAAAETEHMPAYRYLCGRDIHTVPVPTFNVLNGGRNAGVTLAFNEFLVVPYLAETIYEAVEIAVKVFRELGPVIEKYTGRTPLVAHSYGWAGPTEDPRIALNLMQEAIDRTGFHDKCCFALDCASSEMYDKDSRTYYLNGDRLTGPELVSYAKKLTEEYPFLFIEDLLDENDWENFALAHREIRKTLLIGDDLIVTNRARLEKAYREQAVDGFILKPNQVGTLTEAFDTYQFAVEHNMYATPSGRSGGVVGDIVMDLAVGLEVTFQKNGCPRSGELIDKLNFLMRACGLAPGCTLSDLRNVVKF